MPRNTARSVGLIRGSTPSPSSSLTPAGITPSPQALSTGVARRSSTTVDNPRRAAWMAMASPAGPPPAIATSTLMAELDFRVGKRGLHQPPGQSNHVHRLGGSQLRSEEAPQRFAPPHLSAGRARQGSRLEDFHRVGADSGAVEHRLSNPLLLVGGGADRRALRQDEQLLAVGPFRGEAERDDASGANALEGIHASLEFLRLVVCTPDDDQVLGAPADVELPAVDESQVAGIQPAGDHGARGR